MHRTLRRSLFSVLPLLAAGGLIIGAGAAASASSGPSAPSPAAQAQQAKAAAIAKIRSLRVGFHSAFRPAGHSGGVSAQTPVDSSNWSGYADTGSSFSQVSAGWTEPSANCSGQTQSLASFWVGIDGFTSTSVEQDGTIIECLDGSVFQFTWWEMFPTNDIQVVGSTLAPGDPVTASVTRSGTSYTLAVTDSANSANSFTTTQTCATCANSSAEWIGEAPASGNTIEPLADFGTWSAGGAAVTQGSTTGVISSFTDDEITMVGSSGAPKATPSALNSSGDGFSVTWDSAT